ncbi:major facilitator superfamily domain-containing protein [Boeremia exigua]|uniref:major facilitator superfamily domain-containing protein n=1 Tax=Boeremia exigua TaxID=749465 RepID=UPI001E8E8000|nr:major facilitator superfamily domain-containing protein [Boeremia exigua]KAH6643991.1 major facilitator superfamily domain-containing protein [Boeremia exigua]
MSRASTSIELQSYPETTQAITHQPSVFQKGSDPLLLATDPQNAVSAEVLGKPDNKTTAIVMLTVVFVTMTSSMLSGVVAVALPSIAKELKLGPDILLWPISIYALTCGCTLLLFGSIADVVGSRPMYLIGCFLQAGFTLACGLAETSTQIIVFRGFAGIAISFCLPSAVSIITSTFPQGKSRNIAFASMGGGQPIGFSIGLVLGGVFAETIGWRWAFHISAIINSVVFAVAAVGLPKVPNEQEGVWSRLKNDIDWIGISIGSAAIALLSFCFSVIAKQTEKIKEAETLSTLVLGVALIPSFILWVGRQEKLGRPAVIPNSLWRNRIFSVICAGVFIIWGTFNAVETFQTLYFQDVQEISPIQTSLRFLPTPIGGALSNVVMGLVAHRVRADLACLIGVGLTSIGSLLMCVIQPEWTYWACAFPAVFLNPVGADVLFTISNLVITAVFPARDQALAGSVFNTVAQIGKSVGLATGAVIAASVTQHSKNPDKESPTALMEGYRAAFWYVFALSCGTGVLFAWGLRGIGKVGMKRD